MQEKIDQTPVLSDKARTLILPNTTIKSEIAKACGVDNGTVHRWIKFHKKQITQAKAMQVIMQYTGLPYEEILFQETVA